MKDLPFLNLAFGQILKHRRESLGITQQQLAEKIGGVRSYVQFMERGKQTPTAKTLILISEALGQEPDEMLREVLNRMRVIEELENS